MKLFYSFGLDVCSISESIYLYLGSLTRYIDLYKEKAVDLLIRGDAVFSIALDYYDVGLYKYISKRGGNVIWVLSGLKISNTLIINLGKKVSIEHIWIVGDFLRDHRDIGRILLITQLESIHKIARYIGNVNHKNTNSGLEIYIVKIAPFNSDVGVISVGNLWYLSINSEREALIGIFSKESSSNSYDGKRIVLDRKDSITRLRIYSLV